MLKRNFRMIQMNGLMLFGCIVFLFTSGALSLPPSFNLSIEKIQFENAVFSDTVGFECTLPAGSLIDTGKRKLTETNWKKSFPLKSVLAKFHTANRVNTFNQQYAFQFLRNPISLSISEIIFPFHFFW